MEISKMAQNSALFDMINIKENRSICQLSEYYVWFSENSQLKQKKKLAENFSKFSLDREIWGNIANTTCKIVQLGTKLWY